MPPFHLVQIERFLRGHQLALAVLLDEAYTRAGGHYVQMTPEQRQHQALLDSAGFTDAVLTGGIDRAAVQEVGRTTVQAGIAVEDIIRMSGELETLVTAFVQEELVAQPQVAAELIRRVHNVTTSYRANLTAAHLDSVLRRFRSPQ